MRLLDLAKQLTIPLKVRRACVLARKQVGVPYVFGGNTPAKGFDCSGLVQYVYAQQGVKLPRTSQEQWTHGDPISRPGIREGDVLFFQGAARPYPDHEGLYLGSGLFVEAPHSGARVRISKLDGYPGYMGARRYVKWRRR